jgi:hypothetical protein
MAVFFTGSRQKDVDFRPPRSAHQAALAFKKKLENFEPIYRVLL